MIAFVDLIAYGDAIGTGYLAVMDMSSRTVTRLNNEEAFYFWPKWSPDSRFLAVSDNYKIWLINVANGEKQYLIEGEGAAWSPNGELLAIFQGPKSGSPQDRVQIVFVNRKGEKLESISMGMINPPKPTPLPAPTEPGVYILPVSPSVFSAPRFAGMDWSPNGQSIAYSIVYPDQKQSNIFRLNMNGTGIEQLTREGMNEQPTWSPDGTKIAYISGTPVPHDLFIATSDGDCRIPLTQGGGYVDRPSWSPDGRQIAIRAYGTIYILDVHAILEDESSYLEKCR
jgi:Tol biopolymer transport system component